MVKWPVLLGAALASCVLAAMPPRFADAQTFPVKPVRFVVPFATGGASDIVGRVIGQKLGELWGQTVVIDNRAGGSGMIGTELVARAAPPVPTIAKCRNRATPLRQSLEFPADR